MALIIEDNELVSLALALGGSPEPLNGASSGRLESAEHAEVLKEHLMRLLGLFLFVSEGELVKECLDNRVWHLASVSIDDLTDCSES